VTDVQASVSLYHFTMTQAAPGRFVFAFSIPPNAPGFFHGHYVVTLSAHGRRTATSSLALDFE
jgi:hypothetical protein